MVPAGGLSGLMLVLGLIAVGVWAWLLAARGGFWRTDRNDLSAVLSW